MKKIISFALLIFIILLSSLVFSQNVEFNIENFQDRKRELKKAIYEYNIGDDFYIQHRYKDALKYYLKANNFNPQNAELNYKISKSYLYSGFKAKSIPYLIKAYKLNSAIDSEIHFYLAQAYQFKTEWDKAISEYEVYASQLIKTDNIEKLREVKKKIKECKTGKKLSKNPLNVKIENLGAGINSEYTDYGAVVSADESILMFTSRREKTTGKKFTTHYLNEYYEDIYISYNKNGKWTRPENIGKPVNTKAQNAIACISADGQKLLLYKDDDGDGNIYECILKQNKWSEPRKLDAHINSPYHESSASLSYDGKTLYFVSARPEDNKGGRDIYLSKWNEKLRKWGRAINLGQTINTKYDEESVFIHSDGKTLYFSSKGHNTMGGYDIFKSVFENGKWSVPENIGYPINTPDDDVFYVLSESKKYAYYASIKEDGLGKRDIYRITFIEGSIIQEEQPELALLKNINSRDEALLVSTNAKTREKYSIAHVHQSEGLPVLRHTGKKNEQNLFKEVFKYNRIYSVIKENILNKENKIQINEMYAKYERERKQKRTEELLIKEREIREIKTSKNKYLIFGLLTVAGLGTVITLLFMQQYNLQSRQKTIKLGQELLYSQMNPHFVFNSLIAIQSYMFKKSPIEAGKYLSNFANLVRLSFKNSEQEYIPINKEIKALEHYLALQQLRFENKFDYNIEVAPNINVETMAIPPMLAQPFIENAIEYGIMHKNNKGRININFNLSAKGGKNHKILCEIQDNGIAGTGRTSSLLKLTKTITKDRVAMLNKKSRQKIKINTIALIDKNNNAQGTKVVISIPFKEAVSSQQSA